MFYKYIIFTVKIMQLKKKMLFKPPHVCVWIDTVLVYFYLSLSRLTLKYHKFKIQKIERTGW